MYYRYSFTNALKMGAEKTFHSHTLDRPRLSYLRNKTTIIIGYKIYIKMVQQGNMGSLSEHLWLKQQVSIYMRESVMRHLTFITTHLDLTANSTSALKTAGKNSMVWNANSIEYCDMMHSDAYAMISYRISNIFRTKIKVE